VKILIACEYSGIVRDAFLARGHEVWSCDIVPTERPGPHIVNDVRNVLDHDWDMLIAHPPCTHMSYAGVRWFKDDPDRWRRAREDFAFFMQMINAPIPRIAVENVRGYAWKWHKRPDQVVQPFHFGEPIMKSTCFWLKDLPPLMATLICTDPYINWTAKGKAGHQSKYRSKFWPGMAAAMAAQWG
jgi:hypothetical protein